MKDNINTEKNIYKKLFSKENKEFKKIYDIEFKKIYDSESIKYYEPQYNKYNIIIDIKEYLKSKRSRL